MSLYEWWFNPVYYAVKYNNINLLKHEISKGYMLIM